MSVEPPPGAPRPRAACRRRCRAAAAPGNRGARGRHRRRRGRRTGRHGRPRRRRDEGHLGGRDAARAGRVAVDLRARLREPDVLDGEDPGSERVEPGLAQESPCRLRGAVAQGDDPDPGLGQDPEGRPRVVVGRQVRHRPEDCLLLVRTGRHALKGEKLVEAGGQDRREGREAVPPGRGLEPVEGHGRKPEPRESVPHGFHAEDRAEDVEGGNLRRLCHGSPGNEPFRLNRGMESCSREGERAPTRTAPRRSRVAAAGGDARATASSPIQHSPLYPPSHRRENCGLQPDLPR